VLHWGRPRPDLLRPFPANGRRPEGRGQQQAQAHSQRLPHRIEARETLEDQSRLRDGPELDLDAYVEDLPPGVPDARLLIAST
jgi:hypothetical protein